MPRTKEEILEYRNELEADINELLEKVGSDFTLDDVKKIIYNEEDTGDMQKIIAMFDTGEKGAPEIGEVLEIVTDAWNYLPHKLLGGLSPAEMSLKK